MLELNGKIDINDLEHIRRLGHKPIAAIPCPIKWFGKGKYDGHINPQVSRFLLKDGKSVDVIHIKPIYYLHKNGQWRPLYEIASYYGNRRGMTLKEGWEEKLDFNYLAWYVKRLEVMKSKYGVAVEYPMTYHGLKLTPTRIPLLLNTTSTFYPDPDIENTSVDGRTYTIGTEQIWATKRGESGNAAQDSEALTAAGAVMAGLTTESGGNWGYFVRSFFLFDTSAISDTDTIDSATQSIYADGSNTPKIDNFSEGVIITNSNPVSNTALVVGDHLLASGNFDTAYSSVKTIANWSDAGGYNDFTYVAGGLSGINKTGITKTGLMINADFSNSEPTHSPSQKSVVGGYFADQAGTDKDPKLVVVHTAVSADTGKFFSMF